jgi:crotonobetainyl-CoA:carnitine CoA-transferase CaiB-like acyl-CoA transferase
VIKIERRQRRLRRGYDSRVRGLASHFVWTNRSKESLTLDVKHPEAAKVLERLVARRPTSSCRTSRRVPLHALARLRAARRVKPQIIVCDISGYGDDGPYRDKKAYDLPHPERSRLRVR